MEFDLCTGALSCWNRFRLLGSSEGKLSRSSVCIKTFDTIGCVHIFLDGTHTGVIVRCPCIFGHVVYIFIGSTQNSRGLKCLQSVVYDINVCVGI